MPDVRAAGLMLQGASSSVGKSFLTAGLCRMYARRGLRVAPFKSQNMSLNAAVTCDGAEVSRAQAVQAEAARVPVEAAMNPILLKAEGASSCQVVVMGRPIGSFSAAEYRRMRESLWRTVTDALESLRRRFDLVLIEGAGSPAEMNLRDGEIVNMRVAAAADAPVILVGDIERGGVFAALLGTLDLLPAADRERVRGLIVNRFRGDASLFDDGVRFLEQRASVPVLGVVPHLAVRLPAEDSLDLDQLPHRSNSAGAVLDIAVVELHRISNFDELQPLAADPGVALRLVREPGELGHPDLVILPGSKTTASDLERIRASGLAGALLRARAGGAAILGICGGFQMLGEEIVDPDGIEGPRRTAGLGLLPVRTTFAAAKVTARREGGRVTARRGLLEAANGTAVSGYEMHMGRTTGAPRPAFTFDGTPEGATSDDGWVVGTSIHGTLTSERFRRSLLQALARRKRVELPPPARRGEDPFESVADALEASLNVAALDRVVGL